MAPSQIEHQQEQTLGQGYTHKKFNCGYSHKKLGLRLRKREQDIEAKIAPPQTEEIKINKPSKGLFRPYALDENNTPRKRKLSKSSESLEKSNNISTNEVQTTAAAINLQYHQQQQNYFNLAINVPCPTTMTPMESCDYSALSPNSYNMRLQRQRAALYMRYLAQIQQSNIAPTLNNSTGYPMGYPNVTAPLFNGC